MPRTKASSKDSDEYFMIDAVIDAFWQSGENSLFLNEIYILVRELREKRGLKIEHDFAFKAHVRYVLQMNSAEKGQNCFVMIEKGTGEWIYRPT